MDPRDNPPPQTPSNVDPSTKTWFENLDAPNLPPFPSDPLPPRRSKWKLVVIVIAGTLLAAGLLAYMAFARAEPAAVGKCLNNSSYEDFLGIKTDDRIDSQVNFYTRSVDFLPGETTYSDETNINDFLKKVGVFYQNHQTESSITISITSDYLESHSDEVAKQRITKLKQELIDYGVAEAAISTDQPEAITSEDPEARDIAPIVSITSRSTCQEN